MSIDLGSSRSQGLARPAHKIGGFIRAFGHGRQVSHLAARPRFELAVEMQLDVGEAASAAAQSGSPASPAQATDRRAGWPSPPAAAVRSSRAAGRRSARTCCSNWLVTQASNVRWPELCGRGASSLTSSSPSARQEELDAQHADVRRAPRRMRAGDLDGLARRSRAARRPARSTHRGCGCGACSRITP